MGKRLQIVVKNKDKDNGDKEVFLYVNASEFEPEEVVRKAASNNFGQTGFIRELLNINAETKYADKFSIDMEPFGDYEYTLEVYVDKFTEGKGLEVNKVEGDYLRIVK